MGLFDAFSSSDENKNFRQGFQQQKKYAKKGLKYSEGYYGQGKEALTGGKEEGLGYLGDAYGTARGDLTGGINQGLGYLDEGVDQAAGYINQGIAPQADLYGRGTQGLDAYWNLINNPDSIYNSELYKSRENAGVEGINRLAAGRGMLASGNNTQDILDYMRQGGLDYFNTLTGKYAPYFGLAQGGAAGMQAGYNQLGGLYDQLGANKANLAYGGGRALSDLASQYGANQANIATGTGTQLANLAQGQGQLGAGIYSGLGQAGSDMYTNMANAQSAADANLWGAILGGVGGLANAWAA